jgi:hypothetical protein
MPTPHGLPATRPPEIDEAILGAVTCGLLEGRRLDVAYGSQAQGETMRCELTPLGLVFKGALAYLVCTFWDYPDVRQVARHRVHRAEVIVSSGRHRSYWTNLRRMIRSLAGVPHDYYPRGRVVFVKADQVIRPAAHGPPVCPSFDR